MRGPDIRERTDGDLVEASLRGSEEAFGELVRRYQDLLYRHAERMTGGADDAADVVQTAFIRAHRRLRGCRDPERFGPWVFRICANACKDVLKSKHRSAVRLSELGDIPAGADDPGLATERSALRTEIERALLSLTIEQREAFLLKHVEGWSYAEIAEALGVSVSALKMRVHRARDELQVLLKRYGV